MSDEPVTLDIHDVVSTSSSPTLGPSIGDRYVRVSNGITYAITMLRPPGGAVAAWMTPEIPGPGTVVQIPELFITSFWTPAP